MFINIKQLVFTSYNQELNTVSIYVYIPVTVTTSYDTTKVASQRAFIKFQVILCRSHMYFFISTNRFSDKRKYKWFFDTKNDFLISRIYEKFWYQKMILWYQEFNFLIKKILIWRPVRAIRYFSLKRILKFKYRNFTYKLNNVWMICTFGILFTIWHTIFAVFYWKCMFTPPYLNWAFDVHH